MSNKLTKKQREIIFEVAMGNSIKNNRSAQLLEKYGFLERETLNVPGYHFRYHLTLIGRDQFSKLFL